MKNFLRTSVLAGSMMLSACFSLMSCGGGAGNGGSSDGKSITGGGSSFDKPLFDAMFAEYYKANGVKINYQSIGSGAGIAQLTSKTIDFGASDAPTNGKQDSSLPAPVVHIPVTAGAVVLSYNLPEVKDTLKLTPEIISGIFLGKITKWNDAQIAAANPGAALPATQILVAHRSDGSGTTNIFTTYLSKVSPEWDSKVGKGSTVSWPVGIGGKGNEGVAGVIKQTPGTIGYVELAYAANNNMQYAKVKNKAGNLITPSSQSAAAAAQITLPADAKISLTNSDAPDGYPITGFSWIIIYKEQSYNNRTQAQAESLVKLVDWMIHDGQNFSTKLQYAPLSSNAVTTAEAILKTVTYNGQPVLK